MDNKSSLHNRRSIRLKGYDYSSPGAYFVTIVTHGRLPILGKLISGEIQLSILGRIIEECWQEIPSHFPLVSLDAYVIMPNHLHGIVNINDDHIETAKNGLPNPIKNNKSSQNVPQQQSLGAIIGLYKSSATKRIRQRQIYYPNPIWQRNYYEHIIRNEEDYEQIFDYIQANPLNWENDEEFIPATPFYVNGQ